MVEHNDEDEFETNIRTTPKPPSLKKHGIQTRQVK